MSLDTKASRTGCAYLRFKLTRECKQLRHGKNNSTYQAYRPVGDDCEMTLFDFSQAPSVKEVDIEIFER